jgi:hypothetical protein
MSRRLWTTIGLSTVVLVGVAGSCFKQPNPAAWFSEVSTNLAPPGGLLDQRSVWPDPRVIQYNLEGLAAYLIERPPGGEFERVVRVLEPGYQLKLEPIENGLVYESEIDSGFAVTINATLPFLGADFTPQEDQMFHLTITDAAKMYVADDRIPFAGLCAIALRPNPRNLERYWVQGVLRTDIHYRQSNKVTVTGDATPAFVGATFKAGGNLYSSRSATLHRPMLTMLLVNIGRLASDGHCVAPVPPPGGPTQSARPSPPTGAALKDLRFAGKMTFGKKTLEDLRRPLRPE